MTNEPLFISEHVCPVAYVHRCPTHGDQLVVAWPDGTVDVLPREAEDG
jgi:hypothetical protein